MLTLVMEMIMEIQEKIEHALMEGPVKEEVQEQSTIDGFL
jgi:hypothetical protein